MIIMTAMQKKAIVGKRPESAWKCGNFCVRDFFLLELKRHELKYHQLKHPRLAHPQLEHSKLKCHQ